MKRPARVAGPINPLQGAPGQATPWTSGYRTPARPPLARSVVADACVIGAGMAGLSVAYELASAGLSVVVLDDGAIGSGMTSRTTAHLATALDDRFYELEKLHGIDALRLAARSHADAIDEIERIVAAEHIDCDFERVPGYLFLHEDGKLEALDRDLDAANRAGLAVSRIARAPLEGFDTGPCNRFERQGAFHPLKYLGGLVEAIERLGGMVCPTTHADSWTTDDPVVVTTSPRATVTARSVVFATNVPINDQLVIHSKQAPYLTHVVAARIPKGAAPHALFWDFGHPYHYVRLAPSWRDADAGFELLLAGGDDYKTGQAPDGEPLRSYARLEEWARVRFPAMREVVFQWSGQVMEPVDRLGYIGRDPLGARNAYVVTGDCGMGMTHGAIAGVLIRDLVLGRENPWVGIYDPSRKSAGASLRYARENLNVARQLLEHLTPGEVGSEGEIPPDAGAIVRRGLSKSAVYRDASGEIHEMSARCPHLGCIVAWNQAERTWDCPCHGSRFDAIGKVISGPANTGLAAIAGPVEEAASEKRTGAKGHGPAVL